MAVSRLKSDGSINDFNLQLAGATTSVTLTREYSTGAYSISSGSQDTSIDIYAYNADGSLAGYTSTKSLTVSKGFNKIVVLGGTANDVLGFSYKQTYETVASSDNVSAGPVVSSLSKSALPNEDDSVVITGHNFASNAAVHFIGQDAVELAAKSVTRTSATSLTAVRPDDLLVAQSPFSVKVTNPGVPSPVGSLVNVATNAISAGTNVTWVTSATLTPFSAGIAYSTSVEASDVEDSAVTYSLVSGAFPEGISLASDGSISGTSLVSATEGQAFTATIRATDAGNNFVDRTFTINANLAPVWVTAAGAISAAPYGSNYSSQLEASTGSLGGSLTYSLQSGSLFTGLSLSSSGVISGTSSGTIGTTSTFTVRVTDSLGAYSDREFTQLSDFAGQQVFTSSTTWTVPENVSSVSVVAVGAGGGGSASTTALGGFSGGGGAGGALHWRNTIAVTAGETLSIGVGAAGTGGTAAGSNNATAGGESFVKRGTTYLVQAPGGEAGKYNLNNTSLGGVANIELGGGGGNGGRGGSGSNGEGIYPLWSWDGTTATANISAGTVATLNVPSGKVVTFDLAGGKGGSGSGNGGGYGGRVQGTFTSNGSPYYVYVGGAGSSPAGGFNGGGNGGSGGYNAGGGGGATDIRTDSSLNSRIAIAAGGGGHGSNNGGNGGAGGGTSGSSGTSGQGQGGAGATSSGGGNGGYPNGGSWGEAGQLGIGGPGGSSYVYCGGGGGGGYYGGGGGGADVDGCCSNGGGGGGGSSYWNSSVVSNGSTSAGHNGGPGYAIVSFATTTSPNSPDSIPSGGGGGAGGYSGDGGDGSLNINYAATAGNGGGGSGSTGHNNGPETVATGGGGVGLLGEGTSGAAPSASMAQPGNPGSGGAGKNYGGGGAGADDDSTGAGGIGGAGAVRIIWGSGRAFPSTMTGDVE